VSLRDALRSPSTKLPDDAVHALQSFVRRSRFAKHGGVVTDLDGTAVHEWQDRIVIAEPVEAGLIALRELGRPTILNSLRFPLSVIRTFGREWYRVTGAPVPTVSLNGSQIGHIVSDASGALAFDEIDAFPLVGADIDELLAGVRGLRDAGVDDIALFYYPRDWTRGELLWTPSAARVSELRQKYSSAAEVVSIPIDALAERLHSEDICMLALIVDVPQDQRMVYQHTQRTSFVTRRDVDKLFGARAIASHVGVSLVDSIGAGDTELDTFLAGVGLSLIVGNANVDFKGRVETLRLADSLELGKVLFELARLMRDRRAMA
jgi:hydroxymethylpyrimidine pyrophosphatase-like HAD family hydrolase